MFTALEALVIFDIAHAFSIQSTAKGRGAHVSHALVPSLHCMELCLAYFLYSSVIVVLASILDRSLSFEKTLAWLLLLLPGHVLKVCSYMTFRAQHSA